MNKMPRYIVIIIGVVLWPTLLTASLAFAQDSRTMLGSEAPANASNEEEQPYASVTLTNAEPTVEEYSTTSTGDVPDFIQDLSYYTLGVEDVIEVTVLRHPEVSGEFIINNEGNIQFQFIGDVKIEGMKKDEVKELLTKRLEEYIISPNVTVKITGYNSKIVYVIGEVGSPGKIFMRGDTITVREALVEAGLPLLSAKVAHSKLITPSASGNPEMKMVNVHKLLYEGDLRENLIMKPGDTLYVPPTFLAKTMRVIQPVTQPINAAGSTGRRVYTGGF